VFLTLGFGIVRCVLLYLQFVITEQMKDYANAAERNQLNFLLKYKRFFQNEVLSPVNIPVVIVAVLFWIPALTWGQKDNFFVKKCTSQNSLPAVAMIVFLLLTIIGIVFIVRLLGRVKENFFIKAEMKYLAYLSFLCIVFIIAINAPIWKSWAVQAMFYCVSFPLLVCGPTAIVVFGYPYMQIRKTRASPADAKSTSTIDESRPNKPKTSKILDILQDPKRSKAFEQFLTQEFSVENLLFFHAVKDFKASFASYDADKGKSEALRLFNDYCKVGSVLEVNISAPTRFKLYSLVEAPTEEMFDVAQDEIVRLMAMDSFRRFIIHEDKFLSAVTP